MRRILAVVMILMLLNGCKQDVDKPMKLRQQLTESNCTFIGDVTADYGDEVYEFSMNCQMDTDGKLDFQILKPDSISGISGQVTQEKGTILFDDKVVAFPVLCEGQLTPVSAPWHLMHTLRSGYIAGTGSDGDLTQVKLDDSYESNALHLDVWLNREDIPVQGEIFYDGRRVLTISVKEFHFL